MRKNFLSIVFFLCSWHLQAQKRALHPDVYDSWQHISEKSISNDGNLITYTILTQEGDGKLVLLRGNGSTIIEIERGCRAQLSQDGNFLVFIIKPRFAEFRAAKAANLPSALNVTDTLGILDIATLQIQRIAQVSSFYLPTQGSNIVAYQLNAASSASNTSSTFVIQPLGSKRKAIQYPFVQSFSISPKGNAVVMLCAKQLSGTPAFVIRHDLSLFYSDTIMRGVKEAHHFTFSEDGTQLAFLASPDSFLTKKVGLFYHQIGYGDAEKIADASTKGMPLHQIVSANGNINFSKTGKRLFFYSEPVTTTTEKEKLTKAASFVAATTFSLPNVNKVEKQHFLCRYDFTTASVVPLASEGFPVVLQTKEGDGDVFYTLSDSTSLTNKGSAAHSINLYAINPINAQATLIVKAFNGNAFPSYTGKFLLLYPYNTKKYAVYNANNKLAVPVAADITYPLQMESTEATHTPLPYGIAGWMEEDAYVLLNDRYDVWKVDPNGKERSIPLTFGRYGNVQYRYLPTDTTEVFIRKSAVLLFSLWDEKDQSSGLAHFNQQTKVSPTIMFKTPASIGLQHHTNSVIKAKNAGVILYTKETFSSTPNVYLRRINGNDEQRLTYLNQFQQFVTWGSAKVVQTSFNNQTKNAGIVYFPEAVDSLKKYPVIVYFDSTTSADVHDYHLPVPSAAQLNISLYVSNGYLVFAPIIPPNASPKMAYDLTMTGIKALLKKGVADSSKVGVVGYGKYADWMSYTLQQTKFFTAAWVQVNGNKVSATSFNAVISNTPVVIVPNNTDSTWAKNYVQTWKRKNKRVWWLPQTEAATNNVFADDLRRLQIQQFGYFNWLLKNEKPAKWITDGLPALMKNKAPIKKQ